MIPGSDARSGMIARVVVALGGNALQPADERAPLVNSSAIRGRAWPR
jgi:hypothetical protein